MDLSKTLIIQHDNCALGLFNVIDIVCCLISSYSYVWLAYFGDDIDYVNIFRLKIIFELIFTISIILKFVTSFIEEGETLPENDHKLIYENYRDNGGMKGDLITWFPIIFFFDCSKAKFFRLFYLIKVFRINKAL